jgi:DNA polymerase-3 subunit delta'
MFPENEFAAPPAAPPTTDLPGPHRIALFGYDPIAAALIRAAQRGVAGQAYLIAGPPGVGKRTLARLFAQALVCGAQPAESRPCGHCRACRLVAKGESPDLHLVPSPLRIEAARALGAQLALAPVEAAHRVAILPEIELASPGAANSLLKTIEEPPPQVVLVLTAAELAEVLPTIRSRCQLVPMRPLPVVSVADALIAGGALDEERARLVARLSGGRLGWAIGTLADASRLGARDTWLAHLQQALASDTAGRMTLAAKLSQLGDGIAEGLAVWSAWWRDLLLMLHGLDAPLVNRDRLPDLRAAAARYGVPDCVASLKAIEDTRRQLAANANAQLALEVLCLGLPR